jgi:hypothetical protein
MFDVVDRLAETAHILWLVLCVMIRIFDGRPMYHGSIPEATKLFLQTKLDTSPTTYLEGNEDLLQGLRRAADHHLHLEPK